MTTGNSENFSLAEFISSSGLTLEERVKPFSDYYRSSLKTGHALYGREIVGSVSNRVQVRDAVTGDIREMVMMGSNNYLGLTTHPHVVARVLGALEQHGAGMGGPPLLGGISSSHRELERRLAVLKGGNSEEWDAMIFASGYQANIGWLNALLREGDVLLFDELNHASLYDGIALSGGKIRAMRFRHNDCDHLKALLERFSKNRRGQIWVAVEGVYSMDGDLPPLQEIQEICAQYGAYLMVDDAHGTGVMGPSGAGTAEHFGLHGKIDVSMGTFSKAFGTTGGFIVARRDVIDYMRFFSRSYMFSASLPPTTIATVLGGLEVLEKEPERIAKLQENSVYLFDVLKFLGCKVKRGGAIVPVLVPEHIDIRELNRRFHEEGVFLNSVEYPAVARDEQRLRLSVMSAHTREDLDLVIAAFKKLMVEVKWRG